MNDEYYDEQLKKYEGVSLNTIKALKGLSVQRAILQNNAMDEEGHPIYTEEDANSLDSLSQSRKDLKSFVNSLGKLKDGLIAQSKEDADLNKRHVEKGGLIYTLSDNPSMEAQIAFDIHLIDNQYEKEEGGKETDITEFLGKFFKISEDSMEDAINFLKNNLGVTFSSQYWDNALAETANVIDNKEVNEIEANKEVIKEIREKRNALSQLKRLRQDHKNPIEILGDQMDESEQEAIKKLVEEINFLTNKLIIPESVKTEISADTQVSSNRAYDKSLELEGITKGTKEEYTFILKHITSDNLRYLSSLEYDARQLDSNKRGNVSNSTIKRLDENKLEGETYYDAFLKTARTKLLPYYKRYTPEGYESLKDIIEQPGSDMEKKL
jgi:hypothetical protein